MGTYGANPYLAVWLASCVLEAADDFEGFDEG